MHRPDPTPDSHVLTTFAPDGAGTPMTLRMTLPDAATRAAMPATGMEQGMKASYARLERVAGASVPSVPKPLDPLTRDSEPKGGSTQ
jgi:hypothetical protein